ncbi:hypothetical protein [Methylobacterium sp. B1]|uniref:hypothetical protein n=1 Tax=Methylobacterium sp. B1 TaxID=91459 RepID=UPI0005BE23FB|nr:hypothetical protein [Methylobacterium sp. B1]
MTMQPDEPFRVRVVVPSEPSIVRVVIPAQPAVTRRVERGDIGPSGLSAYQVWLSLGHVGSMSDFIVSLKGDPGNAHTTAIAQPSPSAVWTLTHGLNRYPSVTLVDTAGDQFLADISFPDANTITVRLAAPTAGTAYLN